MKKIKVVHKHTLPERDVLDLMKRIHDFMVEENILTEVVKIVIRVVIIPQTDETYAEVNFYAEDGANYEDYFDLV